MAGELPAINGGLFPDGVFGIRGWRRNQGIIEQYSEQLLGDVESSAQLDKLGKVGVVEDIVEQARRAPTRAEQRPYMSALAQIADSLGAFEYERFEAGRLDERVTTSIADAAKFVDVTQHEQLAQLADGMARAKERAEFDPEQAMEDMRGIEGELRDVTKVAGERLNRQFIEPLREHEFNIASTMQQLTDVGGENLQATMSNDLTTQVLQLAGASLQQSADDKFAFRFGGLGWTPSEVPSMTYQQGIARLQSALKGQQDYVNQELTARGAPNVRAVEQRLSAGGGTGTSSPASVEKAVESAVSEIVGQAEGAMSGAARAALPNYVSAASSIIEKIMGGTQPDIKSQAADALGARGRAFDFVDRSAPLARQLLNEQRGRRAQRRGSNAD